MSDAQGMTERLARQMLALPDLRLRVRYLRATLDGLDPALAADVLLLAQTGAEARTPGHGELFLAAALGLADEAARGLRDRIGLAAVARGHEEVAALLEAGAAPDEGDAPEDVRKGRVPEQAGRPLTLGERKALARRADRRLIERALRDPHPSVIEVLLDNPTVTETDVVRLAARRTATAPILRAIFRSPRWIVRHAVKRALVRNPRTPLAVALALAPHLDGAEAREVAQSPDLAERLRRACDRRAPTLH